MKLKSITISGYKSIASQMPMTIEFDGVSVLLGVNGSGKSNIISFFRMLYFMMSGSFQLFVAKSGTSEVLLHYGAKHTKAITGDLVFESGADLIEYKFMLEPTESERLIISSEKIWKNGKEIAGFLSISNFNESLLVDSTIEEAVAVRKFLLNCKVYQFHDSSEMSAIRKSAHIDDIDYLHSDGSNLAAFLHYLRNKHEQAYKNIVGYISYVMPQFRDFYLEPNEQGYVMLKWKDSELDDHILFPGQLSDGTIRFVALATVLLQPSATMPSMVIIDEPELGLHPFAITQLAEMVKEASRNAQVILATQSSDLVDEFRVNQITVMERNEENNTSIAIKLEEEEFKEWLQDYSLSDLWHKNVIGGGRP